MIISIRNTIIGILVSQLFILFSCTTYHFSNEEKIRVFFPVKDENIITQADMLEHQFNLELFSNPEKEGVIQFVTDKDVLNLLEEIETDLLLILYNPNCSTIKKGLEIAKYADTSDIPYLLISDRYNPDNIKALIGEYDLINKNQYILPSLEANNNRVLTKRQEFISNLSPESYEVHKDDLIFSSALIISKSGSTITTPRKSGEYSKSTEEIIDWIKGEIETN